MVHVAIFLSFLHSLTATSQGFWTQVVQDTAYIAHNQKEKKKCGFEKVFSFTADIRIWNNTENLYLFFFFPLLVNILILFLSVYDCLVPFLPIR